MNLSTYISEIFTTIPLLQKYETPWAITQSAEEIIRTLVPRLSSDEYRIEGESAIHVSASIESGAMLKGPVIVSANAKVGPHACLRKGTFLGENSIIGPSCEIRSSFIFKNSHIAHMNFVGDSLLGSGVNMEAGSIIANRRNELNGQSVQTVFGGHIINTGAEKFGALVGDEVKIGANAVLAPGTILSPDAKIERLQLVDHIKSHG